MFAVRRYLMRVGSALSQLANVMFLGGHPNESISGRSYREGWRIRPWIDAVLGKHHCRDAYLADAAWADSYLFRSNYRE
jgi:hypothetical protein